MENVKKTILITGASSGIGLETARYFFERGWNVVATMRNPEKRQTPLHGLLTDLLHLDVGDALSIKTAIEYTLDKYARIDVLVNNAGYAVFGPFEAATPQEIERQYNTNVFGLMQVTQAVLPVFRKQKDGVLINLSSMGGRAGFPLYSVYNSTKWAVEGFSEALQYELKPLNIKVKLIEPGVIETDFYNRSMVKSDTTSWNDDYGNIIGRAKKLFQRSGIQPRTVACTIYQAAIDGTSRLRYPVGSDAFQVSFMRWLLPERLFFWLIEKVSLA